MNTNDFDLSTIQSENRTGFTGADLYGALDPRVRHHIDGLRFPPEDLYGFVEELMCRYDSDIDHVMVGFLEDGGVDRAAMELLFNELMAVVA